MDIAPDKDDSFIFSARLTDESWGGDFGGPEHCVIHDIMADGRLIGDELTVQELLVTPIHLPYAQCPQVEDAVGRLVGKPLRGGWRGNVLDNLGGTRSCTHVMTLLLGLSEVTTQVMFLQMNQVTEHSASSRADGTWLATGLDIAPRLADACHSLRSDGVVLSPILKRRSTLVNETVDTLGCEG